MSVDLKCSTCLYCVASDPSSDFDRKSSESLLCTRRTFSMVEYSYMGMIAEAEEEKGEVTRHFLEMNRSIKNNT